MSHLGRPVVYRVPEEHHTETVVGQRPARDADGNEIPGMTEPVTQSGSVYHRELREFAGIVTRHFANGAASLTIFPPNQPPKYVPHEVTTFRQDERGATTSESRFTHEGDGPGTYTLLSQAE